MNPWYKCEMNSLLHLADNRDIKGSCHTRNIAQSAISSFSSSDEDK